MKIHHLTLIFVVFTNGLLSTIGARLKCPSVHIANGSFKIRSKGRIIVYKCSRGFYLLGEAYAACIKGKWDSNPPVCLKPGCPRLPNLLNGRMIESWRSSLLKFTCDSGYKLIGQPYIYCNGRQWSAPQPHCQAIDIKCDFEKKNTCNWVIDDYDEEDFNWRLQQHEPSSRVLKTGPLHDHTLSPNTTGHYLILDTSDYIPQSKPARIHSPVFPRPSDNSSCFIFWYHMYGNTIGTLNVFLNNVLALQRQGNHGDRWIKGVISLSENVTSTDLQIIIEGSYGGGYTGDMGLDDFSISNGTDCITSKVKSCVGRCYEDKNDALTCLCNPECSIDDSCCEDFMDVCSIESTTPFFEASTGAEDSSQVYSDTYGTTDYETSFSESISSTELGFTSTLENSFGSSSFSSFEDLIYSTTDVEQSEKTEILNDSDNNFYSPSTIQYNVVEENIKNQSTVHNATEFHSLSTASYVQKEKETTNSTEETIILNRYSSSAGVMALKNIQTTERTALSEPKNNITVMRFYNTTTEATTEQDHLLKTTASNNSHITVSTKSDLKFTKFINSTKTTIVPQTIATKQIFLKPSTNKKFDFKNKTGNSTTYLPFKINTFTMKKPDVYKTFSTVKTVFLTQSTTPLHSTKVYQTTPIPKSTSISTSKYVSRSLNPLVSETHIPTIATTSKTVAVQSSTNATLKNISVTPSLEKSKYYIYITTIIPIFNNATVSTTTQTKLTTSKVDSKEIFNYSHTHLQTTSRLPLLFNTTEESVSFSSIITNAIPITPKPVNSFKKKWKSIYKPKDKFMFSAVQSNRDSKNKTYMISACAIIIGAISILLVVIFIRRRRRRFVNQLEEADTDILYHSSQEMLDLHVARPNH